MKLRLIRLAPEELDRLMVEGYVTATIEFHDGTEEQIELQVDTHTNVFTADYYHDSRHPK